MEEQLDRSGKRRMSESNNTENDAEIARLLAEEDSHVSPPFCSSSVPRKHKIESMDFQRVMENIRRSDSLPVSVDQRQPQTENASRVINEHFDSDCDMAFTLQLEEIIISETIANKKIINPNHQLEIAHANVTKALQPTEQGSVMTRTVGMITTINMRFINFQGRNQQLIDQVSKLAIQLRPVVMAFIAGKQGRRPTTPILILMGLATNMIQGGIQLDEAKQVLTSVGQMWTETSVWYEFIEQLVYLLMAVAMPTFCQGAMNKIVQKIESSTMAQK